MGYQLSNPSNGLLGSIELIFLWKQSTLIALTYLFTFCNSLMNVLNDFGIFFYFCSCFVWKKKSCFISIPCIFRNFLYEIVYVFLVWMLTHYILILKKYRKVFAFSIISTLRWIIASRLCCSSQKTSTQRVLHSQYHGCWWLGDARNQGISSHDIDFLLTEYSSQSLRS